MTFKCIIVIPLSPYPPIKHVRVTKFNTFAFGTFSHLPGYKWQSHNNNGLTHYDYNCLLTLYAHLQDIPIILDFIVSTQHACTSECTYVYLGHVNYWFMIKDFCRSSFIFFRSHTNKWHLAGVVCLSVYFWDSLIVVVIDIEMTKRTLCL